MIFHERPNRNVPEHLGIVEERQPDDTEETGNLRASLLDDVFRGVERAARRDEVIHDEDALARANVSLVDFDLGGAVLEGVLAGIGLSGKLALFADFLNDRNEVNRLIAFMEVLDGAKNDAIILTIEIIFPQDLTGLFNGLGDLSAL